MQDELIILVLVMMVGCAYSSYKIGTREGIAMAIDYFAQQGYIEVDED
tara:strand:- start:306 stop:449 length:144 start_codon:yes stop_codon:yes gene_type:complete